MDKKQFIYDINLLVRFLMIGMYSRLSLLIIMRMENKDCKIKMLNYLFKLFLLFITFHTYYKLYHIVNLKG